MSAMTIGDLVAQPSTLVLEHAGVQFHVLADRARHPNVVSFQVYAEVEPDGLRVVEVQGLDLDATVLDGLAAAERAHGPVTSWPTMDEYLQRGPSVIDTLRGALDARGEATVRDTSGCSDFVPDDANAIDSEATARGWVAFSTDQDSNFFGVWVHVGQREVLTFAEGDVSMTRHATPESFAGELAKMAAFYGPARGERVSAASYLASLEVRS